MSRVGAAAAAAADAGETLPLDVAARGVSVLPFITASPRAPVTPPVRRETSQPTGRHDHQPLSAS